MIHKVKISNFKSINELELKLGRVNVFIGENGCGKTNILEAIALGSVVTEGSDGRKLRGFELSARGVRVTDSHLLQSIFNVNSKKKDIIKIDFSNQIEKKILIETIYEYRDLDKKIPDSWYNYFKFNDSGREVYDNRVNYNTKKDSYFNYIEQGIISLFGNNALLNFFIFCPENYFLRRFEEEGQIRPLGTRGEGLFKHILEIQRRHPEIIQKLNEKLKLIDWFGGFNIPDNLMFTEKRLNIRDKYLEDLDYFDQRSANEGFLYLLFYFTLFMSPYTPGFFAIDNIDTALNPKLAAKLIKELTIIAKENNKQVLLTTHNPGVLDGLDLEDEQQKLFTVYRNIDGETYARAVRPLQEVKGVEKVRLSEAFIRGYLGGIPSNF